MGDGVVRSLYMAACLEELNKMVTAIPKANPKILVKSAQKLLKEAETTDLRRDQERAYVLYMRFFSAVQTIQQTVDYKSNKKYYDGLLDPKATVRVISRAEELQKSLKERYQVANNSLNFKEVPKETSKEKDVKMEIGKPKKPEPVLANGITSDQEMMTCQQLYRLMTQRSSSYIILDTRPRDDFRESHMTLPKVINVPEEILRPGLTAGRIGNEIDDSSRSIWTSQRHMVDYIIMVDWQTETLTPPPPLKILSAAMCQWDPGRQYKSQPKILQGGYDLWRLMYPMLTTNSRVEPRFSKSVTPMDQEVSLQFEYPDLDIAFISSANSSSQNSKESIPEFEAAFISSANNSLNSGDSQANNTKASMAQFKPKGPDIEVSNVSNNRPVVNEMELKDSLSKIPQVAKINFRDGKLNSQDMKINTWDTKDTNMTADQTKNRQKYPVSEKMEVVDSLPSIPSRTLKPKDLLASLSNKDLIEEREMLEESVKIEQDTIKKIEEVEATSQELEKTLDEQSRNKLQETEELLLRELKRLQTDRTAMEEREKQNQAKNEEMWRVINQVLANQIKGTTIQDTRKEQQEHERLRKEKDERKALQNQVEEMRRERKEKERRMKEQAEKDKKRLEEKAQQEEEARKLEERKARKDGNSASSTPRGDTYTTKLKHSPRSSPIRGGSNLRRSHSAFNLSQQEEENEEKAVPNFDRTTKPFATPLKRNLNAARQRNFDPKYGSVPLAKTGLKNLGNTCYMNSILQCLSNTGPLAEYFVQGYYSNDINPSSKCEGEVAEEVAAVIRALRCGQFRSIAMWDLKNVVGRYHRAFQGYDQHDSHEFLVKLLDWVHEDLNKRQGKRPPMKEQNHENILESVAADKFLTELQIRDLSITTKLFQGLHRSRIQCETCDNVSLTFEPFSVVSLSFPDSKKCTLKDMLNHYYKDANIEYKCCKCKTMRNCVRKLDVWKLPPLLILHLNRFEHDVLMKKKQNFVDFPLNNLNMYEHLSSINRYTKYDLYAVSNHYGTMDGGHYTAFCKSPDSKFWYKYDDHEVYEHTNIRTHAAYLLFYQISNGKVSVGNFG